MQVANAEYVRAVHRASKSRPWLLDHWILIITVEDLHTQISDVLRMMLVETDVDLPETAPVKAEA